MFVDFQDYNNFRFKFARFAIFTKMKGKKYIGKEFTQTKKKSKKDFSAEVNLEFVRCESTLPCRKENMLLNIIPNLIVYLLFI